MTPPPFWFVKALSEFASEVYQHTGMARPVARVSLSKDFGLGLGIAPGTSIDVHTAAGYVEVYTETTARSYGMVVPSVVSEICICVGRGDRECLCGAAKRGKKK